MSMITFLKKYTPYYKDYKKQFIYAITAMVMVSIGTSGTAYIIKPVLDDIFINKDTTMLSILPFFVILLYTLKGFGSYFQSYYVAYIGQDIIRRVRDKMLFHILKLDISFFQEKHGGELISRITGDINRIQAAISNHIASLFLETFTIIGLVGVVIVQSPKLAFYGLIVLPLAGWPLSILAKKMKKLSFKSQEKNSDLTTILSEIFHNIEIIVASSTQEKEVEKFKEENKNLFKINLKSVKANNLTSPIMEITGSIAAAFVIFVGGNEVIEGRLSVGSFFSFTTALFMLYSPIKRLSKIYNSFQEAIAADERITEIMQVQGTINSGNEAIPESIDEIKFQNISLKYGEKIALNKINLNVKCGQTVALVGDSGGGKSSLINLIVRFYDAYEGEVLINSTNIQNFDLEELRKSIAIVTQRVYIFNDTIAKNVAYGFDIDEAKVVNALQMANAYDFVCEKENGIYEVLDEFGTNLSGGQRQRIAIARALYKEPKILIFDEATSALDNESESEITNVVEKISKNKITFIIAHRLSTIKNANKIVVFKAGKIICEGNENELLEKCLEYQVLKNQANL